MHWNRTLRTAALIAAVFLGLALAACTAPTIRAEKVLDASAAKVRQLVFVYQKMELKTNTVSKTGVGEVSFSVYETGLDNFGTALAQRAGQVLPPKGLPVLEATVVPAGEWRTQGPLILSRIPREQLLASHLLIISPLGGRGEANSRGSHIRFYFRVRLIEASSAKPVWEGHMETSTARNRGLFEGIKRQQFDDEYADAFLGEIVETLQRNKLL